MYRLILLLTFLQFAQSTASAADLIFVRVSELSEKNIQDFQSICDQTPGIKFIGFCHDLKVVELDIDRSINPDNDTVFMVFKKIGITDFNLQTKVKEDKFLEGCKRFQPRS